jgi:signal recognition particle receptor subunit beta
MALIDLPNRTVRMRVVYAGPASSGKTTNLRQLAALVPAHARGPLVSIAANDGHTLVRDDLPLDLGEIAGWRVLADLATIPGQPELSDARQAVLAGADAIVFVADSDPARQDAAVESMVELRKVLAAALRPDLPIVLQVNKRDLPDALPVELVTRAIGYLDDAFTASAIAGDGVIETIRRACQLAARNL